MSDEPDDSQTMVYLLMYTEEYLVSRIAAGQPGYGTDSVGDGKASPGSKLIMQILERDDPRQVEEPWLLGSSSCKEIVLKT